MENHAWGLRLAKTNGERAKNRTQIPENRHRVIGAGRKGDGRGSREGRYCTEAGSKPKHCWGIYGEGRKKSGGSVARKKDSGRPRTACTPANTQTLTRMVAGDPKCSLRQMARAVGISAPAVQRAVKAHLKKKSLRAVKSPNLTPANKAGRAEKRGGIPRMAETGRLRAGDIVFSDAEIFSCGQLLGGSTQNSRCWVEKAVSKKNLHARDIVVGGKSWPSSVTAGAAISHNGCIGPRIIERGVEINDTAYLDLVRNVYAPGMALLYGGVGKFAFTHDNAPSHTESGERRHPDRSAGRA